MTDDRITIETLRAELAPLAKGIADIARALNFKPLPTDKPPVDQMRDDVDHLFLKSLEFGGRLSTVEDKIKKLTQWQEGGS